MRQFIQIYEKPQLTKCLTLLPAIRHWHLILLLSLAGIYRAQGQGPIDDPVCLPIACGYLSLEICPIPGNVLTCQDAVACTGVSDCNNVQYDVRLRLDPLYPYQDISLEYINLDLTLRFGIITPGTPVGGLSHINVDATESTCNNQWSKSDAIKVENNQVLFYLVNEENEEGSCPEIDPIQFTNGVCHLFNVVITGYPGEVVNLACQELSYDSGGPFFCANLCNNGSNPLTVPTPALGTIDGSQNLELSVKEVNPGQTPRQVQIVLKNNSPVQPVHTIQDIDFALKTEFDQNYSNINVSTGNSSLWGVNVIPEVSGFNTRYSRYHIFSLSPTGFTIGANNELVLCELTIPGPDQGCFKSEIKFSIEPDGARIRTNLECSKLNCSTDVVSSSFGEFEECDPASPYTITVIGDPFDYDCNNTIEANIGISTGIGSTDPVSVYYLKIEIEFLMNGPVALTGLDESEWGICSSCASFSGNTVTYLLDVDPANAVTFYPEKYLKALFAYGSNGSVQSFSIKCLALGIIDPITQEAKTVCITPIVATGFPLAPESHQITGKIYVGYINPGINSTACISDVSVAVVSQEPAPAGLYNQNAVTECINNPSNPPADPNYFACVIPSFTKYRVTPSKDNDPLNGVTTFDLVVINKHILGLEPLNSPYKMIAADANSSRSITTFDIVELRKLILGIYQKLPNNTSWRFVDASHQFTNPNNPFSDYGGPNAELEWIDVVPNFNAAPTGTADFIGVKIGDVNGNSVNNLTSNTPVTTVNFSKQFTSKGKYLTIPVTYTGSTSLEAYQMGLKFNPGLLEWVGTLPGNVPGYSSDNFGYTEVQQGNIRTLWMADPLQQDEAVNYGAVLFYLKFRIKGHLPESAKAVQTDDAALPNMAWSKNGTAFAVTSEQITVDRSEDSSISQVGFSAECHPNPTNGAVRLAISGANAGQAVLKLCGAYGNLVLDKEIEIQQGDNEINIQEVGYLPAGIYLWKVRTLQEEAHGLLIKQ